MTTRWGRQRGWLKSHGCIGIIRTVMNEQRLVMTWSGVWWGGYSMQNLPGKILWDRWCLGAREGRLSGAVRMSDTKGGRQGPKACLVRQRWRGRLLGLLEVILMHSTAMAKLDTFWFNHVVKACPALLVFCTFTYNTISNKPRVTRVYLKIS